MTSLTVHRPARTWPPAPPTGALVLAAPPLLPTTTSGRLAWLQYLLPVAGSVGSLVFVLANPSPLFLIGGLLFAATGLASGLGLYLQQRSSTRGRLAADRRRYRRYLDDVRPGLEQIRCQQQQDAHWRSPPPASLWDLARHPERLWERRPSDPDFLVVRVGRADQPLATAVRLPPLDNPLTARDPDAEQAAVELLAEVGTVTSLPFGLTLRAGAAVAILGARGGTRDLARALVAQVAALHAPGDVAVAICASPDALGDWEWAKWLPHCACPDGTDDAGARRLIATRPAELTELLGSSSGPARLVVVVDQPAQLGSADPRLAPQALGAGRGACVLHLLDSARDEPGRVDVRLRLSDRGYLTVEDVTGATGAGAVEVRADAVAVAEAELLARTLAGRRLGTAEAGPAGGGSDGRAADEPYLGSVGEPGAERPLLWPQLSVAEQLRVALGTTETGSPLLLDLKEAAYGGVGPHGLVVGATGSGKSELLRTLVTGLALTHPPEAVSFVLVDFKGGAAFAGLAGLPHVAGLITNLAEDPGLVDRMQAALHGELRRRQRLLRDAGDLDSVAAYDAARRAGAGLPALPTLLLVVDEFSELLSSRPDVLDLVVTIGRLGRSLGVCLLLASQRLDEGRLRGLESHLSYRIALRTFTVADSRAVLGVGDAYGLPAVPGSAYLKVHTGGLVRFRAAMVSGRRAVTPVGTGGRAVVAFPAINAVPVAPTAQPTTESVMAAAVRRLARASTSAHQVWLPPLEPALALDSVLAGDRPSPHGTQGLPIALGVVDRPSEQTRTVLVADLAGADGHLAVVGASQSGKSTLLRSLLAAACTTCSPARLAFYCVDLGGGSLAPFERAPHVGTVAGRGEPERVRRVVRTVASLVAERERRFAGAGIDSVATFRAQQAAGALPEEPLGDVVLVIDDWAALRSEYEDLEPLVLDIAARGLGYGVHLVLSAARWSDIRPGLRDSLVGRLELRLGDPNESEVDRRQAASMPADVPGRGLTGDGAYFQVALPRLDGRASRAGLQQATEALVDAATRTWVGLPVPAVQVLPAHVDLAALADADAATGIPIGLAETDLAPVSIDLSGADPHLLLFGDGESGRTTFLRTFLASLCARTSPEQAQVLVVDYRRRLLDDVDPAHLLAYAGAAPATATLVAELCQILDARLPGPDLTTAELRARSWWSGPEVYVVVDDYELVATAGGNPLGPLADYLPQARDLGLHVLLSRRAAGASRAMFEPFLQRLKELGGPGLLLAGDPAEGPLLAGCRPTAQPPGRALLVRRSRPPVVVQIAMRDPAG
ncbi:MAG: type VII secretion protein EccCb [Actinomycetota bacterium]|nr:type VII secretion protein EccCb [Actinomycetota bacterium]